MTRENKHNDTLYRADDFLSTMPDRARKNVTRIKTFHLEGFLEKNIKNSGILYGREILEYIYEMPSIFWSIAGSGCFELAPIMFGMIRHKKPKVIVEVGTGDGFFTATATTALEMNGGEGKVYTMDIKEKGWSGNLNMSLLLEAFKVPSNRVEFIVKNSNLVLLDWEEEIDFLFIDGSKDPIVHAKDLFGFGEFVKPGRWIFVHDYGMDSVADNVKQFAREHGLQIYSGGSHDVKVTWAAMRKE